MKGYDYVAEYWTKQLFPEEPLLREFGGTEGPRSGPRRVEKMIIARNDQAALSSANRIANTENLTLIRLTKSRVLYQLKPAEEKK